MATLDRHRVTWTGFVGAPGVSTFYVATGSAVNTYIDAFFAAVQPYLPADVTVQVEPLGDSIDSSTGALVGTWTDTSPGPRVGAASGPYSAVSGGLVQWGSSTFLSGRRLRGHTFLVPLDGNIYDTNGAITGTPLTAMATAAQALVTSIGGGFYLWQRPRLSAPAYTDRRGVVHPAISARSGGYGSVLTGTVRSKVTELRSRRD